MRKSPEIMDRRYRVYTQNLVETKDIATVNGRGTLSAVDTRDVVEGTEAPEDMETTEDPDVQGIVLCL